MFGLVLVLIVLGVVILRVLFIELVLLGHLAQIYVALVVEEVVVGRGHVNRPAELLALRLAVDLLDGHVVLLAPADADARVQVVELGCAQRDVLVLVLVRHLHLQLLQALTQLLHLFALHLVLPIRGEQKNKELKPQPQQTEPTVWMSTLLIIC